MDALAGPWFAASVLLVVAGVGKVLDPMPLSRALRQVKVRVGPGLLRVGAAVEAALGVWAIGVGSRAAVLAVAASYVAFTAFVALALVRGGVLSSCGCFGRRDLPPTRLHVLVTASLAAVCLAVAARPLGPAHVVLADQPAAGLPLLVATGALAVVVYLALAVLPLVSRAARRTPVGAAS